MLHLDLQDRLQEAVKALLPDADLASVQVRACPDPKFGDYQTSALMALAKERKMNPRQLATDVLAKLKADDLCEKIDIAGAGFLNFRLKPEVVGQAVAAAFRGEHLFFRKATQPRSIVIDFSSPNVAKPMHVGHIRSTILGESLSRIFRFLGHRVVTDNHIGDWGTAFGKILIGWKESLDRAALERDPISEMERLYKKVNAECDVDEARRQLANIKESDPEESRTLLEAKVRSSEARLEFARRELVKLQQGDAENLAIWKEMIRLSQVQFDEVYGRLKVSFDHTLGESFYNPQLQSTVDELMAKGIARESQGAKAIFSDGSLPQKEDPFLIQRDGEWLDNPALIQKNDGGFNYATTDLATLAYRMATWQPKEIVYVTDGRQQLHFRQIFTTFQRWQPDLAKSVKLAHVWFGTILGEDGKPFKTRSGDTVKLTELLDEAEERAFSTVTEKNPSLDEAQRKEIARIVGLGSVKYADLSQNRQSDYVFSWNKMLALQGNTAPYLLYAYTRVAGILRKAGQDAPPPVDGSLTQIRFTAPDELALAKHLLKFGQVLDLVTEEYRPNFLCAYLYDLAGCLARFYESCPVLQASGDEKVTRLVLCSVSARVLAEGLNLLGIEKTEVM